MAAFTFVGVQLSLVVIANFVAMSLPLLVGDGAPSVSRVAQQRVAEAQAIPPLPIAKMAAPHEPTDSYSVLAAQLDIAEADDLAARPAATGRRLTLSLRMRARGEPAAAAFNRSFGVIPIASN
jgi:hypothetical protein